MGNRKRLKIQFGGAPLDPARPRGRRRDRVLLAAVALATLVAAFFSALLVSWALGSVLVVALFSALILSLLAVVLAASWGQTVARLHAGSADWTIVRATLDSIDQSAAICDVNGTMICANRSWAAMMGGYRPPLDMAGGDAEVLAMLQQAQANAIENGTTTLRVELGSGTPHARNVRISRIEGEEDCCLWIAQDIMTPPAQDMARRLVATDVGDWFALAGVCAVVTDGDGHVLAANSLFRDKAANGDRISEDTIFASLLDLDKAGSVQILGRDGMRTPVRVIEHLLDNDGGNGRLRTYLFLLIDERAMDAALQGLEPIASIPALLGTLPLGFALADRDGRFRFMNKAFCRISRTEDDNTVLYPSDLVIDGEKSIVADAIRKVAIGQPDLRDLHIHLKDEPDRLVTLTLARVTGFGLPAVILYMADNSDREKLERQVAQATKMQAVGQLAGGVAHDFNNILTAIIGYCDLMLLRHGPGDSDFDDITQIKQNANRAANLVRQLLAFSRQQTLRPQVLQISDVVGELSHLLKRLLGETVTLTVKHGRNLGPVRVDPGQLEQVIVNLAVNARDAMPDGGELSISTYAVTPADVQRLGIDIVPPGYYTALRISDTGVGIPTDILGKIFEPFFTTKEVGKGTGLGLSTVYGIVKQTGGYIFAESGQTGGAAFTIYLPVHDQLVEAPLPAAAAPRLQSTELWGTGTILLVEDEATVRAVAERALVRKGYRVVTAANGVEALERMAEESNIDLLISDVVMPEMDGPTLAGKVREAHPAMPIVLMSGYAEEQLRREISVPGFAFLPKPFSVQQLANAVQDALVRAQDEMTPE